MFYPLLKTNWKKEAINKVKYSFIDDFNIELDNAEIIVVKEIK